MRTFLIPLTLALSSATFVPMAQAAEPMTPSTVGGAVMSSEDKSFFAAAASGGLLEVKASELALQRSQNADVKSFAQKMVTDHTKAAEELKTLASSKNVTVSDTLMKRHEALLDHLQKAKDGKDFDTAYKHVMEVSHKEAVTLFGKVAKSGKDPEVKQWAAKTLPTLEEHGGMAKDIKVA